MRKRTFLRWCKCIVIVIATFKLTCCEVELSQAIARANAYDGMTSPKAIGLWMVSLTLLGLMLWQWHQVSWAFSTICSALRDLRNKPLKLTLYVSGVPNPKGYGHDITGGKGISLDLL